MTLRKGITAINSKIKMHQLLNTLMSFHDELPLADMIYLNFPELSIAF